MKKRIRLQGMLVSLATLAAVFLAKYLFPEWKKEAADGFFDFVGMFIALLGFLFRITARGYKSEYSSEGKKLITSGPYKLTRNPMYLGTLLLGVGISVTLFQWWVIILFTLIYISIYYPQVKQEEGKLAEHFGQAYEDYCKETPRLFPGILSLFRINLRGCMSFKLRWIKKELMSFLITFSLLSVFEVWQDVRLFGYKELSKEIAESILTFTVIVSIIFLLFYGKEDYPRAV